MSAQLFAHSLETRKLLSANANIFSTQVQQDRVTVQADLLHFKADCLNSQPTMLSDLAAIKADAAGPIPLNISADLSKFHTDMKSMHTALLTDRLTEASNALADESTIVLDLKQIRSDKGNKSAETDDHAKLLADRIKLQDDLVTGLNSRIATRQEFYGAIFADLQPIALAVSNDSTLPAKFQADVNKWINDKTTCLGTMATDLAKLVADRTILVNDLSAMQFA